MQGFDEEVSDAAAFQHVVTLRHLSACPILPLLATVLHLSSAHPLFPCLLPRPLVVLPLASSSRLDSSYFSDHAPH